MARPPDFQRIFDILPVPLFVLHASGDVVRVNAAAIHALGRNATGTNLADIAEPSREGFLRYLLQCSGSATPRPGAVSLRVGDRSERFNLHGAVIAPRDGDEPAQIMLRCLPRDLGAMPLLSGKIDALNREVRQRRRIQHDLSQTVRQREHLLQELQHRVKNNLQMLLSMFATARRETRNPEVQSFIAGAGQRLLAISAVQQLMYQSENLETVPIREFVENLCTTIGSSLGRRIDVVSDGVAAEISNDIAFPLALALNELIANAATHGSVGGRGRVEVGLRALPTALELAVQDDGPGFQEPEGGRRASGLGLVRGLCRQINGQLEIANANGARCIIRFLYRETGRLLQ